MNPEHDSSSSDDDGDDERLREALDVRMFSITKSIPKKNSEYEARGTLGVDRYKDKILNVTPEFQSFVAKRLSDTLDRIIEEFQPKRCRVEPDQSAGIRLFTNSETLLVDRKFSHEESACDAEPEIPARIRSKRKVKSLLRKRDVSDELDEERKCRDAAVSAAWILSGECTKGWSKPKGAVFAYHQTRDGVLEAEESSPNFFQS